MHDCSCSAGRECSCRRASRFAGAGRHVTRGGGGRSLITRLRVSCESRRMRSPGPLPRRPSTSHASQPHPVPGTRYPMAGRRCITATGRAATTPRAPAALVPRTELGTCRLESARAHLLVSQRGFSAQATTNEGNPEHVTPPPGPARPRPPRPVLLRDQLNTKPHQ